MKTGMSKQEEFRDTNICQYAGGCNNTCMPGKTRCKYHIHGQDPAKPMRTSKGSNYGTVKNSKKKKW